MAKLKVYRTPIGFHDAYVAASSQKAALAAWGARSDLFARGVAEVVTDAALAAEPLAHPGTVIRRSRGSAAEQIAALPPAAAPRGRTPAKEAKATGAAKVKGAAKAPSAPAAPPRPSRTALAAAEDALAKAEAEQRREQRALHDEELALAARRRAMARAHDESRRALEAARDAAAQDYDAAMRRWRG